VSGRNGDRSSADGREMPRWEQLACDAALFGLGDEERAELDGIGADAEELLALELAAGDVAARAYATHGEEELPAALAERLLADMERALGGAAGMGRDVPGPARAAPVIPFRPKEALEAEPAGQSPQVAPRDVRRSRDVRQSPPRGWQRLREAAPWMLAAAAIALAILGRKGRVEGPVAGPPPAPTADAAAPAPETPASAREALLAIPGTAQLAWKATEDPSAAGASGDVVWHSGAQKGFMRFRGLAANDPAKTQYQLWIFDGERDDKYPVDGGVFNVGPDGEMVVPISAKLHVNKATLFAVTVEKPGGVVVSKRERIVLTAAPAI
jgi:hypothetical protein